MELVLGLVLIATIGLILIYEILKSYDKDK
jgi:hypothetical protein